VTEFGELTTMINARRRIDERRWTFQRTFDRLFDKGAHAVSNRFESKNLLCIYNSSSVHSSQASSNVPFRSFFLESASRQGDWCEVQHWCKMRQNERYIGRRQGIKGDTRRQPKHDSLCKVLWDLLGTSCYSSRHTDLPLSSPLILYTTINWRWQKQQ